MPPPPENSSFCLVHIYVMMVGLLPTAHTWHTQRKFEQPDTVVRSMLNCFKGKPITR